MAIRTLSDCQVHVSNIPANVTSDRVLELGCFKKATDFEFVGTTRGTVTFPNPEDKIEWQRF